MITRTRTLVILSLLVILACGGVANSSGVVTFQVEVVPGFTVSGPDNLSFDPISPGQTTQHDLGLTVWSNVSWELSVRASGQEGEGGLYGVVEFYDSSSRWTVLDNGTRLVCGDQPLTGPSGLEVIIPFRFTGSYEDSPGTYSFQVEFTVVPAL